MNLSRKLKPGFTYWPPTGKDRYGNATFGTPVAIKAFWEDSNELIVDARGEERVSQAQVMVDQDVKDEGYLYQGTSTAADPKTVSGAHEIKRFSKGSTLSARKFTRVAFL